MKVLIAGAGYVGRRLAEELAARGDEVHSLSRSSDAAPGSRAIRCDLTDRDALEEALPDALDYVVYAAAPTTGDEDGYRRTYVDGLSNLLGILEEQQETARVGSPPPTVFFTSSTAVYAQLDGSVVDEMSPTQPTDFGGRLLLRAEARLFASPLPGTALRLGGIYGPGRTGLIDSVRSGRATYSGTVALYTNRIHRDDIAGALVWLIDKKSRAEPIDSSYIFVDDEPAPRQDVLVWLAERLGAPTPMASDSPDTGRRGSRSNKRCSNSRLRATGYRFRYPSFRDGYAAMLAER